MKPPERNIRNRVLEYMETYETATNLEVARALKITPQQTSNALAYWKIVNQVSVLGRGPSARWSINGDKK